MTDLVNAFMGVFDPVSFALITGGTIFGIIFGAIPGLTATLAVILLIPLSYGLEPTQGISMLVGVYIGGISGGVVAAVLLGMPGTPSSMVTVLDGFALAKQGRAGKALGAGVTANLAGSFIGWLFLIALAPQVARFALEFGPIENTAVLLFGFTAVISLSGIVASRSVRCAGDALDQSITSFIKRKYNLLVGERTAEQIKLEIGSACPPDPTDTEHGETTMEIKGRNLVDGLPKDILIRSEEVREAMNENLMRIVEAIKDTLECTPPELSSDIIDRGIMLSGGGALLRGLDTLIQNETGIEVHIAEAPLDCVALGAGAVLDHPDLAGTRREELSYL